jgi:hypothetical protein
MIILRIEAGWKSARVALTIPHQPVHHLSFKQFETKPIHLKLVAAGWFDEPAETVLNRKCLGLVLSIQHAHIVLKTGPVH